MSAIIHPEPFRAEQRLVMAMGLNTVPNCRHAGENMTFAKLLRPALTATLLALVTACGASTAPDVSASPTSSSGAAERHRSANPQPVSASMPDVLGGNAGRAHEQMSSEMDMTFKDASGQDRPVDDPADWKICNSHPGPYQQITDYPVVFDVLKVSENCEDTTSK
ncbi:hypothetical protein ABZV34_04395 [Streptomyces sp. NPDC005195]|uniref:hypothetical protein n=1 Tax=Streptomyces sp. NPDC005195 TaxID=3154561 RepID=UPI0033BD27D3